MLELRRNAFTSQAAPDAGVDINPYGAPKSDFARGPRASTSAGHVWREGDVLVMERDAQLPPRCIKCNRPESTRLLRKMHWHTPWLYLLILGGILVYALVALFVRKKANVHVGLCAEHQQRRQRGLWIAWSLAGAGFAGIVASGPMDSGGPAAFGMLAVVAAIVVGLVNGRIVNPVRIDDRQVRIKGAGREFLNGLPTFAD